MDEITKKAIEYVQRSGGNALTDYALVDTFRSLNMVGANTRAPVNQESQGYVFFTRPTLNLTRRNIAGDPVMSTLLSDSEDSMPRAIRCILDHTVSQSGEAVSQVIDDYNPFIPLLSNNLVSLTGYRDFTNQTHSTESGLYRESISTVDDSPYDYETYDLTANFRNISGDPITYLFFIWGYYAALARIGKIIPYPPLMFAREIDYNTGIWRLVMDKSKRFVTGIHKVGAAFPLNAPIGEKFDFTMYGNENPYTPSDNQISITFRCMGSLPFNPLNVIEFNLLVKRWSKFMRDGYRGKEMIKLADAEKPFFNTRSDPLPYINEETMELEWYVPAALYNTHKALLSVMQL